MIAFRRSAALIAAMLATPALATGFTDPAELDMRVAAFTGAMTGRDGGATTGVDRRLKLAPCAADPALSWRTARQDAVVITCSGSQPWTIYVPVKRGAAAVTATAARAPMAAPPSTAIVIKRGDPVSLTAESRGFAVTREGVALDNAAAGARIKVKVDGASAPVQGVVLASGAVMLANW